MTKYVLLWVKLKTKERSLASYKQGVKKENENFK